MDETLETQQPDSNENVPETEKVNPESDNLDEMPVLDIVNLMLSEEQKVVGAVHARAAEIAKAAEWAAEAIGAGGRLVYIGAGTSGRLAVLDAAECPPTFSTEPGQITAIIAGGGGAVISAAENAEDHAINGAEAIRMEMVRKNDVVIGISASGGAQYVIGALEEAKRRETKTVLVTMNPNAPAAETADLVISTITGPEVIAGSTRLKAGSATKMILNAISTACMVKLGKVYNNYMVELRPASAKLKARAERILAAVTGCSIEEARTTLRGVKYNLKAAIVMRKRGLGPESAAARLAAAKGNVRKALAPDWGLPEEPSTESEETSPEETSAS
ncbi:MAG: N-acetylmuramic acid 6-phosphate etherase [Planctomycetota bacterium]|jgi:N-acetylmuramic acid 6-phosphate etherase